MRWVYICDVDLKFILSDTFLTAWKAFVKNPLFLEKNGKFIRIA